MIIFTNLKISETLKNTKKKMKRKDPSKCIEDLTAGMT